MWGWGSCCSQSPGRGVGTPGAPPASARGQRARSTNILVAKSAGRRRVASETQPAPTLSRETWGVWTLRRFRTPLLFPFLSAVAPGMCLPRPPLLCDLRPAPAGTRDGAGSPLSSGSSEVRRAAVSLESVPRGVRREGATSSPWRELDQFSELRLVCGKRSCFPQRVPQCLGCLVLHLHRPGPRGAMRVLTGAIFHCPPST